MPASVCSERLRILIKFGVEVFVGILSAFWELWDGNFKSESVGRRKSLRNRICRIEEIEPREMLSTTPYEPPDLISVGVVFHEDYYVEQSDNEDEGGDTFFVSWHGGAKGTKLSELVIDLNVYDVGEYLYFFADISQPVGNYNKIPFGFSVDQSNGIGYSHTLEKDSNGLFTKLTITFDTDDPALGFTADKQFTFKIDVNSFSSTIKDDGPCIKVTSVLQGSHFEGSTISAKFESANYETLNVDGKFIDVYSAPSDFDLNVPQDKYYDDSDLRSRKEQTAGVIERADSPQSPKKGSIEGYVYEDVNNDGIRDAINERGIADVWLELFVKNEATGFFESTNLLQKTNANGFYIFDEIAGGKTYRVLEIQQPAGYADGKEQIGTIGGAIELSDAITNILVGANEHGENYNFGELKKGSISGYVYNDKNNNGQKENGENGIANAELSLWIWDATNDEYKLLRTTKTDAQGYYRFGELDPFRKYKVTEKQPVNYVDGKETIGHFASGVPIGNADENDEISEIILPFAGEGVDYNFGELEKGTISGNVYEDKNNNGTKDDDETGIGGITIYLCVLDENGNKQNISQTVTDADGNYFFDNLKPDKVYCVTEIEPDGYCDGTNSVGTVDGNDRGELTETSDGNDQIHNIQINSGENGINYNFAENRKGELSGYVYNDTNKNGKLDNGEKGIKDVTLSLWVWNGTQYINTSKTTKTDVNGYYQFDSLCPFKTYQIIETQPENYIDGLESIGTIGGIVVGVLPANDRISEIQLPPAGQGINYNFAEIEKTIPGNPDDPDPNDPDPNDPDPHDPDPEDPDPNDPDPNDPDPIDPDPIDPDPNDIDPPVVPVLPSIPVIPSSSVPYVPSVGASSGGAAGLSPSWQQPVMNNGLLTGYGAGAMPASADSAWHLSVINGGYPRDIDGPEAVADGLVAADLATRQTVILRGAEVNEDVSSGVRLISVAWEPLPMKQSGWYVRDKNGTVRKRYTFGPDGGTPIVGDFNGDGIAEVAVFHEGKWYIDLNGNGVWDEGDLWAELGEVGDQPIVGDWDGDGKSDIGVFGRKWSGDNEIIATESGLPSDLNTMESTTLRPKNMPPAVDISSQLQKARAMKHSQNGNVRLDVIDHVFQYGEEGDQAFTGDFAGDGIKKIGVYRNGTWYIDYNGNGKLDDKDKVIEAGGELGKGAVVVVGDWDGDGIDNIGLYVNGVWHLDTTGDFILNEQIKFGEVGDVPIVGDFSGSGITELAVYRSSQNETSITQNDPKADLGTAEPMVASDAEAENRTERTPYTDAPLHRHHHSRHR
jgi:hypothetical protein